MAYFDRGFALDRSDSIADAVDHHRRARSTKHFYLTDGSPDLARFNCSACGKPMTEDVSGVGKGYDGNRCEYYPRSGTFRIMHYVCAWGVTLGAICTSHSVAEAGVKLNAAQAQGRYAARPTTLTWHRTTTGEYASSTGNLHLRRNASSGRWNVVDAAGKVVITRETAREAKAAAAKKFA